MAKETAKTEATTAAPKKERKVLTPAERIAKLEAELEAARKKAEVRENKARNQAMERRSKLVEKRNAIDEQIAAIDAEFPPAMTAPVDETNAA